MRIRFTKTAYKNASAILSHLAGQIADTIAAPPVSLQSKEK
jgi:hypothetical protein